MSEPQDVQEPWAATRDASWYDLPDVHSAKAVHMAGRKSPRHEGVMSKCGRSILDEGSAWRPGDVPEDLRCRSNGCRQAWPTSTGYRLVRHADGTPVGREERHA